MLGWLWRAVVGRFGSCRHKWEIAAECDLVVPGTDSVRGHVVWLRCAQCGDAATRRSMY